MGAKNQVVAGDYTGKGFMLNKKNEVCLVLECNFFKTKEIKLNKETVENYELMTDEHQKSAASGVVRGLVGAAALGGVGLLAGALSAKDTGIYTLAINFKDGKKSLLEVDEKIYKGILKNCF